MFTIAAMTFREVIRRRMLAVTVILAVAFLGLYGLAVHFVSRDIAAHADAMTKAIVFPQLLSLGLYFGSFIVSFLAIFAAVGAVSSEIENGTMHAIVPRPVTRTEIILGKFLGYGFMLIIYAAVFFLAIYFLIQNITGLDMRGHGTALALFCLQPLVLLAVTMLGTTLLSTLANGIMMFMLYAVAVVGGMVEQIGWFVKSQSLQQIGIVSSLLMPVDSIYRKIVYILMSPAENPTFAVTQMGPFGSQAEPSIWMLGYTVIYAIGAVVAAVYVFARKDI